MTAPADTTPRWILAGLALGHAALFAWAASVLPWQRWTLFAAMTAALAACHAATGVLALAGSRHRRFAWRISSGYALVYLLIQTAIAAQAGAYVAALYGGLGRGVFAALAALWAVLVLVTLPFAAWGLAATGGLGRPRRVAAGAALLAALMTLGLWRAAHAADATPVPHPSHDPAGFAAALTEHLPRVRPALPAEEVSLWTPAPIACEHPLDRPTLFVAYPTRPPRDKAKAKAKTKDSKARFGVATRCVQAERPEELLPALAAALADAVRRGPIKVDLVVAVQPLSDRSPGPLPLLLRPGHDGVCEGQRCLMPWQLLGLGQFLTYTPLPFIEDLRFGADPPALRRVLRAKDDPEPDPNAGIEGLTRLVTRSFIVGRGGEAFHAPRLRAAIDRLDADLLARASAAAEAHILAAQGKDGRFRYLLHPFTGKVTWRGFAVPRQAGTTLALCELGSPAADPAVRRSLTMLAGLRRDSPEASALSYDAGKPRTVGDLGTTALPLIAFLSCRDRVGPEHDVLIGRLGRHILALQREDGGFHVRADLDTGAPIPGPDVLYAAGQAVFALVLLEDLARRTGSPLFPAEDELRAATQRAMTYFAETYWDHGLASFFYLEENWHCLAARAALPIHRHAGYERFCLDYVDFKRRLILDEESGVAPELVGSYGFGNVLVPHNTPSGGYGEALAAAMAIRAADGAPRPEDARVMEQVLTFLVEQQWDEDNCFACAPGQHVVGGYSESVGSLDLRIDYTQHAWSALGHGGRMLGLMPVSPDRTAPASPSTAPATASTTTSAAPASPTPTAPVSTAPAPAPTSPAPTVSTAPAPAPAPASPAPTVALPPAPTPWP